MRGWIGCVLFVVVMSPASARAQSLAEDRRVASALGLVEAWVEAQVAYGAIPGMSLGIVHDQELVWSKGFGYAHVERKIAAAPDTIYSICSISKLFTSIAIMQLRDQGKLRLDDPLERHLSWFDITQTYPDSPPVTIQGALTHSSGLPRESDFPYWTPQEGYPFPTRAQLIKRLGDQKTLYPADTYYQYSNLGLALAGEVVAAASGEPYAEHVQTHILGPLGMADTSTEIPREHEGGRLATGYTARGRDGRRQAVPFYEVRGLAPAFGYASTVEDLARFASWQFRLLRNRGSHEVLRANTLREMQRVHWVDPDWETTCGVGFSVSETDGKTFVGHGGSCPGYLTQLLISSKDEIAVVVITNSQGTSTGRFARTLFDIVSPALAKATEGPDEAPEPELELEPYFGTYSAGFGGEMLLTVLDDQLVIASLTSQTPLGSLAKLQHVDGHVFRRIRDDDELGESIEFELGADGRATRIKRHSNYLYRIE